MNDFERRIEPITGDGLISMDLAILQVNVGFRCNQQCRHCHLECGPYRKEVMEWPVMERIVRIARQSNYQVVDITGGAPEINPNFRKFVEALRAQDNSVQVRSNLTIMTENGYGDLSKFFKEYRVAIVGSLPCYLEENVKAQRGEGVYQKSIESIRRLNELGYGIDPELTLSLVYNPGGAFLPSDQETLELAYKKELGERFGVTFTKLFTITNMPLGRFGRELRERHEEEEYLVLLKESFNPQTIDGLMCRHQISIGWDGTLYDCDFNLALGMTVNHGAPDQIEDFNPSRLSSRRIMTGDHCFGCTAGCGSSCRGALA